MESGLSILMENERKEAYKEAEEKAHKEKLEIVKGFLDLHEDSTLAEKFKITIKEVKALRAELKKLKKSAKK